MIKSLYFCDRCGFETTNVGAGFALYQIIINLPNANPLDMKICANCTKEISSLINKLKANK